MKNTIIAIALLISIRVAGQTTQLSESTKAYINAYTNLQFDNLVKFYTDKSWFQDPTLELISPEAAQKVVGPDAILEKFHRNFNGVQQPSYELKDVYVVGNHTILNGQYNYVQNATAFGGPDLDIHFSLKSTTVLKENEGKIIEHIDYMDYTSWFMQYEAQKGKE